MIPAELFDGPAPAAIASEPSPRSVRDGVRAETERV
jgi:hypothetical protein